MMLGISTIDDNGTITFDFADGTRAKIDWKPKGTGGDGRGGGYYTSMIDYNTSRFTDAEIVTLAYWNDLSGPIRGPKELGFNEQHKL